jgi:flagellin FlaB
MKSIVRNEDAFTGLEAAIVLIAFVVVAAVFSYVVLGAGFFTTQKSQETVHTAVGQASSAIEIVGNVYGEGTAGGSIDTINFSIGLAAGATPVDIQKTVMTFSTNSTIEQLGFSSGTEVANPAAGNWSISHQENSLGNKNMVLDNGEQFTITVKPKNSLSAYDSFNIDIKPAVGAALALHRTVPAYVDKMNLLY